MDGYSKRFYTPHTFLIDVLDLLRYLPDILRTAGGGRVSRDFAERIMLVVTAVNDCRYCSFGHARMALRSGVSEEEVERLLALDLEHFPSQQAVALAFAQHYAETGRRPDPLVEKRFREYYGPQVSQDIYNYMRLIRIGNLSGNAGDAFLSRLRGQPAPGSRFLSELLMFTLLAPVLLPLLGVMKRMQSRASLQAQAQAPEKT